MKLPASRTAAASLIPALALVADGRLKVRAVATVRGDDRVVTAFTLQSARG